jgi:hypothetical protein
MEADSRHWGDEILQGGHVLLEMAFLKCGTGGHKLLIVPLSCQKVAKISESRNQIAGVACEGLDQPDSHPATVTPITIDAIGREAETSNPGEPAAIALETGEFNCELSDLELDLP